MTNSQWDFGADGPELFLREGLGLMGGERWRAAWRSNPRKVSKPEGSRWALSRLDESHLRGGDNAAHEALIVKTRLGSRVR